MTRNILVQQGKTQLQKFLVFSPFLPSPLGFHWQTQKRQQWFLAISASLVTFKSDKWQWTKPFTRDKTSGKQGIRGSKPHCISGNTPKASAWLGTQSSIIKQQKVTLAGTPQNLFGLLMFEGQKLWSFRKSIFYLQPFFLSSSLPFSTTWFRPCIVRNSDPGY